MPPVPSVIGRYQVRERIGQGGMGALFLALDPAIDRLVALKLLRIDNEEMRTRFLREARAAGRLQHPHIVTVYDVGEHEGQPFIAMEYLKGETLGEVIRRRASMPVHRRLELMEELCEGLGYAHNAGLVHRDIKPTNLMVTTESTVLKILDFGIARGSGDAGLTEVGTMMGTPNYMSPEQASGRPVDQRSDIFAVGAVLYETLLYRQAFPGKDWQVVLPSILEKPPPAPSSIDRGLDPRIDTIVGRAMARDPKDRYQSLRALGRDLTDFRRQLETADAETALPTSTPVPTPSRGKTRPSTDKARLVALRREKVAEYVKAAAAALERGDLDAAQAAAEDASVLDVDDTQVVRLLDAVHDARERQQFEAHLSEARERLGAEALTEALESIDQALALQPDAPSARELRRAIAAAVEDRARARERARLIEQALATARAGLDADTPEVAIRAASEVLVYEPDHLEAAELKQRALAATEERRRREAELRRVRQAVASARDEFDKGDHTGAIRRLERLGSEDPAVIAALAELRSAAATFARLERSGVERADPAISVAEQVALAKRAVADEQWDEAAGLIRALQQQGETTAELSELADRVEQGQLTVRRRREITNFLGEARSRVAAADYPGALAMVDAALALEADYREAVELRREIEAQAAAEEAQREAAARTARLAEQQSVASALDRAEVALSAGKLDDALQALRGVDPESGTATQRIRHRDLLGRAETRQSEIEAETTRRRHLATVLSEASTKLIEGDLAGARRQVESVLADAPDDAAAQALLERVNAAVLHETHAGEAVSQALELASRGLHTDALAALAGLQPSHPSVEATIQHLRRERALVERERRRRRNRERAGSVVGALVSKSRRLVADRRLLGGAAVVVVLALIGSWWTASPAPGETDSSTATVGSPAFAELPMTTGLSEALGVAVREPAPVRDADGEALDSAVGFAASGDFVAAFRHLEGVDPGDARLGRVRDEVEAAWARAADRAADEARSLASAGDLTRALAVIDQFAPAHGSVESARREVQQAWEADVQATVRHAFELAASGDHDGAVGTLTSYHPSHPSVDAALAELRADAECPAELPAVHDTLLAMDLSADVARPSALAACDGGFRVEIQNERVRFATGCGRASATAFVPVLCEGAESWSQPAVLRFLLTKTANGEWAIAELAEQPQ